MMIAVHALPSFHALSGRHISNASEVKIAFIIAQKEIM